MEVAGRLEDEAAVSVEDAAVQRLVELAERPFGSKVWPLPLTELLPM